MTLPSIVVGQNWTTISGLDPVALGDLIGNAPEPPYHRTNTTRAPDYLRSGNANLLYLADRLPLASWHDQQDRLFEAKAYRFMAGLREEQPGEYERRWPFKMPCDPWQLQVFCHARKMREIALAPTALGTGKTKMILDIAADKFIRDEIDGLIVVAPNGVHRQWVTKGIPAHMSDTVPTRCHIWKPTTKIPKQWKWTPGRREAVRRLRVMTFNVEAFSTESGRAFKALRDILKTGRFMLAIDESTRIKNWRATRTKVLIRLAPLAAVRAILTGTPVTKGLEDLYAPYHWLNPGIIGLSSWWAFRNYYCVSVPAFRGAAVGAVRIIGYRNKQELFRKLAPVTFMIGSEVLGLGEPWRERREVALTPEQETLYDMLARRLVEDLMANRIARPQNVLVELLRLQQVLCGWAYEAVVDEEGMEGVVPRSVPTNRPRALANALEEIDGQAVVWSRFATDIDAIANMMIERDAAAARAGSRRWRCVIYDGRVTSPKEREDRVRRFGAGEVEYFLGNPAAGGTGVDGLQEQCSTAVYYSNSFNREHRWQSEGRIYRRGQTRRVGFLDLVCPGTVDELFLETYEATEELAKQVMNSPQMLLARWRDRKVEP